MRQNYFITGSIFVATLAVAYTLLWLYIAERTETLLNAWVDKGFTSGLEISYGKVIPTGFPFAFNIRIQQPRIAGIHPPLLWSWETDTLIIETKPWAPHNLRIRVPGRLALRLGTDNEQPPYTASGESIQVLLHVVETLEYARLDLRNVSVVHIPWPKAAQIARASIHWEEEDNLIALDLDIGGVTLPQATMPPLGGFIREVGGRVLVIGPQFLGTWPETLESWRDDGRTLEVKKGHLHWGPIVVKATGTVTLDSENRPIGAFDTRITGVSRVIESFIDTGQLSSLEAAAINIWLNLLTTPDEDSIRIPATMQEGRLYIGRFAVGRIAPLF